MSGLLRLAHHHPGRVRVRADALTGKADVFALLRPLRDDPRVTLLQHNPHTGSVVVEYDAVTFETNALLERLVQLGGFDGVTDEAFDRSSRREPGEVVIGTMKALNSVAHEVTDGRADLRSIVPAAMALAAGVSFLRNDKDRMPRWDNLLYWSYNVFLHWHKP